MSEVKDKKGGETFGGRKSRWVKEYLSVFGLKIKDEMWDHSPSQSEEYNVAEETFISFESTRNERLCDECDSVDNILTMKIYCTDLGLIHLGVVVEVWAVLIQTISLQLIHAFTYPSRWLPVRTTYREEMDEYIGS